MSDQSVSLATDFQKRPVRSSLILNKQILRDLFWPLTGSISIALIALLLERLLRLMDMVISKAGPFYVVAQMLGNLIPHYLGIAIPAAFFISLMFVSMKLTHYGEWDAIQSLGVGLSQLLKPLMGIAVILTIITFIVTGYLQPHTRYAYRSLVYLINQSAWNAALERGSFFFGLPNTVITIDNTRIFHDEQGDGQEIVGIFIRETPPHQNKTTITAEKAQVLRTASGDQLIIRLENGLRLTTGSQGQMDLSSFSTFRLPLNFSAVGEEFRDRGSKGGERELTLIELIDLLPSPPAPLSKNKIIAEIHGQIIRNLSILILPFWALSFGMTSHRRKPGIGVILGLVVIVLYNQLIELGYNLVGTSGLSPILGLWLPFLIFGSLGMWIFYLSAYRPGFSIISVLVDRTPFIKRFLAH